MSSCLGVMNVTDPELDADRSPTPPRKARRRDHDSALVSDGMDWSNPMTWQHNLNFNPPSSFPLLQNNYLQNSSSAQLHHSTPGFHQYPPVNYMMPFPPPAKTMKMTTTHKDIIWNLRQQLAIRLRYQYNLRKLG